MALDPRAGSLVFGIQDPILQHIAGLRADMAALDERLSALERAPQIQTIAGTPTTAPRDGAIALDTAQPRLWLRRNSAWQFATLT